MPIGSGIETLRLLPSVPYVIDPQSFADSTTENVADLQPVEAPAPGGTVRYRLPDADVVSKLKITFQGTLTVTAAGSGQTQPVCGAEWPYGLLSLFTLTANGISHDLWSCSGTDLHVKNFVDHLGLTANTDVFPGSVGGGGSALGAGSFPLYVTWDVELSTDPAWLVAALYAQSSQTLLGGQLGLASIAAPIIAPGGTAALWSIAGNFYVEETSYEIPIDSKGNLILPDITRLHMFVSETVPWTNVGDVDTKLLRTSGQLMRIFQSGYYDANAPLSALPGTADTALIDTFRLRYGVKSTPYQWNPASTLATANARDYRGPVPYNRLVMDQMLHNPARDMILLEGVTNLRTTTTVDSSVTPSAGAATMTAVEEILV